MGIFSGSSSKATCPTITTSPQYGVDNVAGSFTFQELTKVLCGAFTAVVFVISGFQLIIHATHFSNPGEQVKIIRIISLVPLFALVYLAAGVDLSGAIYFQPWADFYESVALASYFLLLITYLCPVPDRRDGFFDRLDDGSGGSSLAMYRRTWIFVFQYIPVSFIVAVATDITQAAGVYCANGHSVHFAHIWLTVIRSISVILAFVRLLAFYKSVRSQVREHNVVAKLIAIKGIVFLTFVQTIVFTILNSTNAVKPSSTLSYNDIYYGIPSILVCGEMVFFAIFHIYAYNPKPYFLHNGGSERIESQKSGGSRYHGGLLGIKAFMMAMNPLEVAGGIVQAVKNVVSSPQTRHYDSGTSMQPLHYGQPAQNTNGSPPYPQTHSPNKVEYGSVDQYTPLPRRQF